MDLFAFSHSSSETKRPLVNLPSFGLGRFNGGMWPGSTSSGPCKIETAAKWQVAQMGWDHMEWDGDQNTPHESTQHNQTMIKIQQAKRTQKLLSSCWKALAPGT